MIRTKGTLRPQQLQFTQDYRGFYWKRANERNWHGPYSTYWAAHQAAMNSVWAGWTR